MKYLFRIIKILIVSTLTIFLVSVTASYLLLNIPSVQQKVTHLGEKELSKLLDTRLTIGKGHVFPFNKIQLSDVCLYDRQGDTLLYAQKLIAGFAWQELLQKRLVFTTVQLYDFRSFSSKENTDSPLNLQFIIDRFKKNEPSAIDLHSQVNTILARRGKINYDVASKKRSAQGSFDPYHIKIDNFLATVSLKSFRKRLYQRKHQKNKFRRTIGIFAPQIRSQTHREPGKRRCKQFQDHLAAYRYIDKPDIDRHIIVR